MSVYTLAAWSVITGLALMLVGGLVLWAYGQRRIMPPTPVAGPEAEATQVFHTRLSRWFFVYGAMVVVSGTALLLWAGSILF